MTYDDHEAGRVEIEPSDCGRDGFWTYEAVEERLVDAMRCWRRAADSEARFGLGGRISSIWRQAVDDPLALIERHGMITPEPRPLPLSRADMARMAEASDWLAFVPEADRRLVVLALGKLASGHSHVPWGALKRALGIQFGVHGLRKRYSRAITVVANRLNSRKSATGACQ